MPNKKDATSITKKAERLKKKISSLNDVLDELKKKNMASEESAMVLENTISGVPKEIVKRLIKQKKTKKCGAYPPELRSFGLTLRFYSAKAYRFVRNTFNLGLRHPAVIRSWYSKNNSGPGFTMPRFQPFLLK